MPFPFPVTVGPQTRRGADKQTGGGLVGAVGRHRCHLCCSSLKGPKRLQAHLRQRHGVLEAESSTSPNKSQEVVTDFVLPPSHPPSNFAFPILPNPLKDGYVCPVCGAKGRKPGWMSYKGIQNHMSLAHRINAKTGGPSKTERE